MILGAVGVLAVLGAIYFTFSSVGGDSRAERVGEVFFMDMETGEIFTGSRLDFPPIEHDGNVAYQVTLFGCGDCEPENRKVGRYLRFREEDLQEMREKDLPGPAGDPLISADAETWYPLGSPRAEAVSEYIMTLCGGEKPILCKP